MLFLTPWFVLFAAAVFPTYWLIPYRPFRRLVLLVSCVVFHTHFAGPAGVLPIIVLGVLTYLAGLSRSRPACWAVGMLCVVALLFYKYTTFLCVSVIGALSGHMGQYLLLHLKPLLPFAPPLAISFFVFEYVHYLADVAGGSAPIRDPVNFGLFSLFWPSIVAGPVKRYKQFLHAVERGLGHVNENDVARGLIRVAVGLAKKLVADNLTAYIAYQDGQFDLLAPAMRWLVFLAIGLRILWDFSGYSDMAIGFARMAGVGLPKNFDWPYLSLSIVEFWRRWHISLSHWIRDYVYIPIGGNRHGLLRKVFNGLVAFGICGLWHGSAWNFLFWGVYHGAGLAVCSSYRAVGGKGGRWLSDWFSRNQAVAWALTMLFVNVGWLFFFYPLPRAWQMCKLLFGVS